MNLYTDNGKTPTGKRFELSRCTDAKGIVLYARLEWAADEDCGSIGIPLKADAPFAAILSELRTTGELSPATHRASVNT